ncbi:MAG: CCA tRNA nucleotidyltransferase [Thermaurantiacus sp.]
MAEAARALAPGEFDSRPGFRTLARVLGTDEGESRVVGGAIRDALLGLPVSDIDFATRLRPEEIVRRLEAARIRAVPTGLKHGTVTAVIGDTPYEVTTLRHDVATDGRHATVAFTDDWQADAARRDFTINALYGDPSSGTVWDWFDGLADLETRTVRFIGDPYQRIAEDHLRILRFFRFSARFSDRLEPEGLAASAARANDLMALSRERIREELLKLLAAPDPAPVVQAMVQHGLFRPVLPEVTDEGVGRLRRLIEAEALAQIRPDPLRRLAALLPPKPWLGREMAGRLRLSRSDSKRLEAALGWEAPLPRDPRALAHAVGGLPALDRMLIAGDPRAADWAPVLSSWRSPRMPVSGRDLIAMGIPPGPDVSRLLGDVERRWVAAGFPSSRAETLAIARESLGKV